MNASSRPNDYSAYPDERGRFGDYGGQYVPETLMPLVHDLDAAYAQAKQDDEKKKWLLAAALQTPPDAQFVVASSV